MRGILKLMELDICMLEQKCLAYYLLPPPPHRVSNELREQGRTNFFVFSNKANFVACSLNFVTCLFSNKNTKFADNRKVANF